MKWYQHLFWKIFLTIWLISALGTGLAVLLVQSVSEQRQDRELLETRVRAQAGLLLERFERSPELDRHALKEVFEHRPFRWRPIPMWIVDLDSGNQVFGGRRPPPPPERALTLLLETERGQRYQVIAPLQKEAYYLTRMLTFMVSAQTVFVLFVSALASLLLSLLIVRPINRLRHHVQDLYDQQNLSSRADDGLSRRHDEIGELARDFNRMASYVEDTLTGQQRLLQDVSHELRAPLARLQVAAGLAEQRLGEGDATAARINRECERLNGLIGEILSLSRLDQADPAGPPVAVMQLFDDLLADARFSHPRRAFHVSVEPPTLCLQANMDLLTRALGNGLSNALKYTPEQAAIRLEARLLATRGAEIRLRDQGEGVSEELLARLTDPFVRGSGGHGDGYGLGLSIARRAVARLGGTLILNNHPQGGLELLIRLPAARVA